MDGDLNLVIGAILICFAVPALVSGLTEKRFPYVGCLVLGAGMGLIGLVSVNRHDDVPRGGGEAKSFIAETVPEVVMSIPTAFFTVIGQIVSYWF